MKFQCNRVLALVVVSSAFLMAVGCKKSNSSTGGSGQLTATIGSTAWSSNYQTSGIYTANGPELSIGGVQIKSGDSTGLAVGIIGSFPVNVAISSDTALVNVTYVDFKTQANYEGGFASGHSVVTYTSFDSVHHKMAGTFSGVLYNAINPNDSIAITNGTFNSSYISQ